MEPPGKLSGLTTKLSVVMATRVPLMSTWAASPSGPGDGAKEQGSEKAFDQPAAGLTSGSMRHLDLRDRGTGSERRSASMAMPERSSDRAQTDHCRLPVFVAVIRGA